MRPPLRNVAVSSPASEPRSASGQARVSTRTGLSTGWLISKIRAAAAFTLVEMLVVMSVIAILFAVMVPVFKNLIGGHGVAGGINSVSGILELGRATAISNQTYVYILFKNVVNSDNTCELRCAAVWSANNMIALDKTVLKPISKLTKIANVKAVKYSDMPTAVKNVTPDDLKDDTTYIDASASTSSFPQVIIAGEDFTGATYIRFDHDGEIGASGTGDPYNLLVEPKVCLGLASTRGTVVQTNSNDGAIVAAYGGSGSIKIVRP